MRTTHRHGHTGCVAPSSNSDDDEAPDSTGSISTSSFTLTPAAANITHNSGVIQSTAPMHEPAIFGQCGGS